MSLSRRCTRRGRWPLGIAHDVEHAVHVARGAGAALHREPHGLVEDEDVGVLVERDRLEEGRRLLVGLRWPPASARDLDRRNADRLARLQSVLAVDPLAVHPQLAFADDAVDVGERQPREFRLEKAVDPHAGLVRRHRHGLNPGRLLAAPGSTGLWRGVALDRTQPLSGATGRALAASGEWTLRPGSYAGWPPAPLCRGRRVRPCRRTDGAVCRAGPTRATAGPLPRTACRPVCRDPVRAARRSAVRRPVALVHCRVSRPIPVCRFLCAAAVSTAPPARRMQERDEDGAIIGTVLAI